MIRLKCKFITCLLFFAILQLGLSCLQLSLMPKDVCADVMLQKILQRNGNLMKACYNTPDCCWSADNGCKKCADMKISKTLYTDCTQKQ